MASQCSPSLTATSPATRRLTLAPQRCVIAGENSFGATLIEGQGSARTISVFGIVVFHTEEEWVRARAFYMGARFMMTGPIAFAVAAAIEEELANSVWAH